MGKKTTTKYLFFLVEEGKSSSQCTAGPQAVGANSDPNKEKQKERTDMLVFHNASFLGFNNKEIQIMLAHIIISIHFEKPLCVF